MPVYTYQDKNTQKHFDVVRSMKESDQLPTEEEACTAGLTPEEYAAADWQRVIGSVSVVKGQGWGWGKGYWARQD